MTKGRNIEKREMGFQKNTWFFNGLNVVKTTNLKKQVLGHGNVPSCCGGDLPVLVATRVNVPGPQGSFNADLRVHAGQGLVD